MLVLADMKKALVCSINSHIGPYSYLQKLFGEPDDYAYKFGNDTFAHKLPIHLNWLYAKHYDAFHSVSVDYEVQRAYWTNNGFETLNYGLFVHNNMTTLSGLYAVPKTNQVTKH